LQNTQNKNLIVKGVTKETYIAMLVVILFFTLFGAQMGVDNMFGNMFNTAHDLIINTVLFIMPVAVSLDVITTDLSDSPAIIA